MILMIIRYGFEFWVRYVPVNMTLDKSFNLFKLKFCYLEIRIILTAPLNYMIVINNECIYSLKVLCKLPRTPYPLGIHFSWRLVVVEVAMATFWLVVFQKQCLIYTCHLFTPRKQIGIIKEFNLNCLTLVV